MKASDPQGAYEVELQGVWSRIPLNRDFRLSGGGLLNIVSRGTWNVEAGPDFLNAKLLIDGKTLRGAVEIHRRASDWLRHGHQNDPAYSKVILHVVETDDRAGASSPDLPTFVVESGVTPAAIPPLRKGRCSRHLSSLPAESLRSIFADAGLERLQAKSSEALELLISSGEAQAWLARLFDAAGFKANRRQFADALTRYLSYSEEERSQFMEPLLWGCSSLLPDPSKVQMESEALELAKRLWTAWWPLRGQFSEPLEWRRASCRPLNSPERRLSAICALLKKFGENPLPCFEESLKRMTSKEFNKWLVTELMAHDPFWDSHTSFTTANLSKPCAVCGAAKALELAIDVVYPCLLARARLRKDKDCEALISRFYLALPAQEPNRIFRNALERWFVEPSKAERILASAAEHQGVMNFYNSYCEGVAADCNACLLFNSL